MTYPWGHNRRFNAYSNYFKKEFGGRVQKVTIDAGFTCPNRDGSLSTGGCTYCNNNAFNPSYNDASKPIQWQIERGIEFHKKRYKNPGKYLAYFQVFSNTYAPLKYLKKVYNKALEFDSVIGLVIGTRPDCIDNEKLEYFRALSEKYYIIIEYGIESCNDAILKNINRGHGYQQAVDAICKTAEYGIKTGAHLIMGLPGESREDLFESVHKVSRLPLNTIKFHQLQIIKDTCFDNLYKSSPQDFNLFGFDEYVDFMTRYVEHLNPNFVVERFAGESPPYMKTAPDWGGIRSGDFIGFFEKNLERHNTWQGKLFNNND